MSGNDLADVKYVLWGILGRQVQTQELQDALGLSKNRYYRKVESDDYPDAEDVRKLARHFNLDPVELQKRFGLIEPSTGGFRIPRKIEADPDAPPL